MIVTAMTCSRDCMAERGWKGMESDGKAVLKTAAHCSSKSEPARSGEAVPCNASRTMSQSDIWPSDDDASDSQSCHILTSDDNESPPATLVSKSHLRPTGKAPVPMSSTTRGVETSDEEPAMLYNVEWKLSINNRRRAG